MLPLTKQERAVGVALAGVILAGCAGKMIFKLFPNVARRADFIERWSPQQKVDINKAAADELVRIPSIGPVRAQAIIRYRHENGPFGEIGDMQGVPGIGPKRLAQMAPFIEVQGP